MNTELVPGIKVGGLKNYLIGFVLSILFTVISFAFVMTSAMSSINTLILIVILAALQAISQIVFFLHMNTSSEKYWNWLAFIYTLILLTILVGASVWIMYHLNFNMKM